MELRGLDRFAHHFSACLARDIFSRRGTLVIFLAGEYKAWLIECFEFGHKLQSYHFTAPGAEITSQPLVSEPPAPTRGASPDTLSKCFTYLPAARYGGVGFSIYVTNPAPE